MSNLKTRLEQLAANFANEVAQAIKSAPLNEVVTMTILTTDPAPRRKPGRPKGTKSK